MQFRDTNDNSLVFDRNLTFRVHHGFIHSFEKLQPNTDLKNTNLGGG